MSSEAETTPVSEASEAGPAVTPTKAGGKPGSTSNTPSKETDEALTQLVQGRRHLLVKDYFSAVAALAKACELLAAKYGATAPECGDAYLTYGRALLELARSESGVLGLNEAEKSEEEEADAEDDEEEEEAEGEEENGGAEDKQEEADGAAENQNGVKQNGDAKVENGEAKVENGDAKVENGDAKVEESKENADEHEEEGEEDVTNLQLAWEMLELAKVIYQKQLVDGENKQTALKLAEVHLKLGEVAVESENYNTAVEDMKSCLQLQRKHLEDDDRRIAETLYNMGMAYSLANEFDDAIEQFKSASEQIEKRIATLENKKSEPASEKTAEEDPFYTIQGEIDELKALLPDMKEKVSDMQDFKKETVRRMMDSLAEKSTKESSTADGAGPSSASDKPVSSISHLIKRKPKEDAPKDSSATETETSQVSEEAKSETEKLDSSLERKRKQEEAAQPEDTTKRVKVDETKDD